MAQYGIFSVPRKFWFLGVVVVSLITIGHLMMTPTSLRSPLMYQVSLEESIAEIQTRLKFLEAKYGEKQEEMYIVQARVERFDPSQQVTGDNVNFPTLSPAVEELLRNMSGTKAAEAAKAVKPGVIQTPFSLKLMPHLMENKDSLRPAYLLKSKREFVEYIIGIPHVKRDVETYLYKTIAGLLAEMTTEDKNKTMLVVLVGETDLEYVLEVAYNIENMFPRDLSNGLIEVLSPSKYYYPDLKALTPTLGDSQKRTRWRTKQNLDAIFLMAYAQPRCLYYLMVEDDVIPKEHYMTDIRKFTISTTESNPDWFFIQYSTTGGIGKLFRTKDLIHFITYVQLFYSNMPIDWLTESYLANRKCNLNRSPKECAEAKTQIKPTYRVNLFKHVGLYSSLKGKIQKVKDPKGGNGPTFFPHKNPPLSVIKTDLDHHDTNTIESLYRGQSFFWGMKPDKDDVIEFWFDSPTDIGRYTIRSGNVDHPTDKIYNAVFEALSKETGEDFVKIDEFDEFGLVEGEIDGGKFGDIIALRIKFLEPSRYWVIISEIEFAERAN